MAYCCVLHCHCSTKKKPPGVSFHEILSEKESRKKWILVIRRDNWTSNTTSNYSKVCSKHFKETDLLAEKQHRLKEGVIPSVFKDYPLHLQPKNVKERGDPNVKEKSLLQ